MAERKAPRTTFVALHEPFEGGKTNIADIRGIKQTVEGLAVAILGKHETGINDRLMLRLGDKYDQQVTLADERESFTFADRAYVRIGEEKVEVYGDLEILRFPIKGNPKLIVNGEEKTTSFESGYLYYCAPPRQQVK